MEPAITQSGVALGTPVPRLPLQSNVISSCKGGLEAQSYSSKEHQMTLEELQGMPKFDTHAHIRGPLGEREREFVALLQTHNLKWLDICVVGTECVDELAKRLDRYPNFAVDTAARIVHFQVQDQKKVRSFILKYQDRLLYGTDNEVGMVGGNPKCPHNCWNWRPFIGRTTAILPLFRKSKFRK